MRMICVEPDRILLPVWTLAQEVNKNGGAWHKTYANGKGNKKIIPTDLIKSFV